MSCTAGLVRLALKVGDRARRPVCRSPLCRSVQRELLPWGSLLVSKGTYGGQTVQTGEQSRYCSAQHVPQQPM